MYPVARSASQALDALRTGQPRAARLREALEAARLILAEANVRFVTEDTGPGYDTYAQALAAWSQWIDDPKGGARLEPQDRFATLRQVVAPQARKLVRPSARATFKDNRRWALPEDPPPASVWRLSLSYWKIVDPTEAELPAPPPGVQARSLRRSRKAAEVSPETVKALTQQPMSAFKPQKALDIGLFEFRPPDQPHLIIPDE
ncbi:MAG: hypothetical protein ACK41P_06680 [Asticcacaulis sp.]